MKRWLKRALVALCVTMLGITAAMFVGCTSCSVCEHDWQETVLVEATCTTDGSAEKVCSKCGEKSEPYTLAAGHKYNETVVEATCYAGGYTTKECSLCGNVVTSNETPRAACSYEKTTVEATCIADGYDQFTCKWCNDTYKNITSRATGHNVEGATWTIGEDIQVVGCTYAHVETTKCNTCGETVEFTVEFEKHNFVVSNIEHATCAKAGEKTYKCTNEDCNTEYVEEIAIDANAHDWDEGTTEGNVTTYTCTHASAHTKSVYSAKDQVEATVSATVLAETGAVELQNAEMKMDAAVLESLGGEDVTIKADTVDNVTIADEYAEKFAEIGGGTLFDFSITDAAGEAIAFNGKITVTVPYDLSEGEDPENIAIWYIDNEGKPETIAATYSHVNGQGYATFETSHFSVYTVVRLSVTERCNMYGHKFATKVVPATCGQQGYTVTECTRCHQYERSAFTPALVHTYTGAVTAPTCSAMGYTTHTCSLCGDKYVSDYTAKLAHTYETSVVAPTCTAEGYTLHKCSLCGESYTDTIVKASGHNFADGKCSVCGRKDPTLSQNFYFNLIESIANVETLYFEISDMNITVEQKYNNGDTEVILLGMELARAQIGFDETGIVGKGEGTLTGVMKETGSVNAEESYFATAQFLFTNGYIYIYVDGTGLDVGEGRSQMVMAAPQSMMMASMEDEMDVNMEMLSQMADAYGSGALDIITGMAEVGDNPLNRAIKAVVEYIYTKTETENGYSFELNENRLKDMYNILMEKSVAEIFDLVFGKDAYKGVQNWLGASVEKTIPAFEAEVKTELAKWGISLDEVYDYIDSIVFANMEVPEGTKAPSVRDYIQAEELAEVTLLNIINMAMGLEEPLTAEAVKEMINSYGEEIGALKMSDIMAMVGGMNGETSKDSAMNGGASKPATAEAVEEEAPEIDVDAIVDGIVAFLNKIPVTFTTDKNGALIDYSISMNKLDPKELVELFGQDLEDEQIPVISLTYKVVLNGTYVGEYDHIVKEAEKLAGANDIKNEIYTESLLVVKKDGKTYIAEGGNYRQTNEYGKETYKGVECTKVELRIRSAYIVDEEFKSAITAMTDCHGWWAVEIPANYIDNAYVYAWVNAEGKIIGIEPQLDRQDSYISSYTSSVTVYYNPTTGEHVGQSQHKYKLQKNVAEDGCNPAYKVYVCTVCGMEYKDEDYNTGHDFALRYALKEGSASCEDGMVEQSYCKKCGRVEHEWAGNYHGLNYTEKLVYTSPVCGEVYVYVGICPCGEQSKISDWKRDCQVDCVGSKTIDDAESTIHYIETYKCSIDGCGFTYTVEYHEWDAYDATAEKNETCKHYTEIIYDFGNGIECKSKSSSISHKTKSSDVGNIYGGKTYTNTCTLCNQITSISTYNSQGRLIRYENPMEGWGYTREWDGCYYNDYYLDGTPWGSGADHSWTSYDNKSNCTQYAPNSWWCPYCGETQGYYQAPDYWWGNDHDYCWDGEKETYVCDRCGTENKTGADGWIVLEDMVENGEIKVGYFNKRDWKWHEFSYVFDNVEIEIIANYNPDDEENPGEVLGDKNLYDRNVTSPIGYREAGIITLDREALVNALNNCKLGNENVETISVVFWVVMTSETGDEYVIGYGLTFTRDELDL